MRPLLHAASILLLFTSACIKIPETGKSALLLTTSAQENQMGEQGYREVLAKADIDRDARLNGILRRVGTRLAAQTGRNEFRWEFTLIRSKEVNAWCMPGGKVAVYTGILPIMQNEAGMATVLGHEIAHATLRHSGQRITREMIVGLGLSVADLTLSNQRYRSQLMGLMGAGASVGLILPYSRGHESEADAIGLEYMAKAGYDPKEAVAFWKRFAAAGGGAPPEWLSTHPGASTRVADLERLQSKVARQYDNAPAKSGSGERI